jgi:alkaline phosphatase
VAGVAVVGLGMAVAAGGAGAGDGDRSDAVASAIDSGTARNVILFLGDGMGDSEITIARNYGVGANGRLAMDTLPLTGEYTTYAVKKGTADQPDYVTDSAASGTGWSTGQKTYNGAISVDPVTGEPMRTILEAATDAGYKTGNITTAELTDATPAVLDSHISERGCQGPAEMKDCPTETIEAGGLGSIAEQTVDHDVDVLMGGGRARFDQKVSGGDFAGQTVTAQAEVEGYTVVGDDAGLESATPADKVLGLFSSGNMPTEFAPYVADHYPANTQPKTCSPDPTRPTTMPHLSDMTAKAIDLLDAKAEGGKGFFLQVEGASIDKRDHAADVCGQIGETLEFDNAITVGLDYAKSHPDTLVLVTADHGHTSQIISYPQTDDLHSPGRIATVLTHDRQPMTIGYATVADDDAGKEQSQDHTGTEVRIAAQGPQAANVVGVINQTDVFGIMTRALDLR